MNELEQQTRARLNRNTFMVHNFIEMEHVEPDRAVFRLDVRPESLNALPALQKAFERYGDKVQFLMICTYSENDGSGSEDTTVTYKLNGRYSRLTGVYFLPFSDRDTTTTYAAALYADGEQVWSGSVTGGVEPISIDVDLTGVQELKLVMHQNAVYAPSIYYYFGDLTLFA